ncbi:glycosyltransferase family 4 protein [Marinilabilia salmonicolor]|uniref:Glycosyltransferase involved in cell wall biosynthesis n=1 Tax=Marinilabilia salmonicolor TaxID=989 RepID=A0A368UNS7_9BACT|nr:glycosyltransferase family 4 protein [Marinilabilia salmonicolor]RCW29835.1 glycosyltransferase involved in cell wall biosynthesis [Marinilabilia salmonicolor]
MKVLHINKSDHVGGAAVAAVRLLDALHQHGTDVRMLVLEGFGDHARVELLGRSGIYRQMMFLGEVFSFVPFEKNRQNRFSFSRSRFGFDISRHPLVREADVIHLHWINQGFLSLKGLRKLIDLGKPVVWTLHDTWPFTGGCHYPGTCGGFTSTCGQCPMLKSPAPDDLSARQHETKEKIYKDAAITFVGCSRWMQKMAAGSSLVRKDLKHEVEQIFNPVDTWLFRPVDKMKLRQSLGLPEGKNLLLFGAANVADPRKGIGLLLRALNYIAQKEPELKEKLELMVFGKNIEVLGGQLPFKLHSYDVVTSEVEMAGLYQAADLFVLPSMQDNLPNTVVESMACGTPVVAFQIGGVPEMVHHMKSGFLSAPGKSKELALGILSVLENHAELGRNARIFAEENFDPEVIAQQYQKLYQQITG